MTENKLKSSKNIYNFKIKEAKIAQVTSSNSVVKAP